MKAYRYETHLHTSPASKCGRADVRSSLTFYKRLGYDGVFITNHFINGNIGCSKELPYEEKLDFYFADYEEGLRVGQELGIRVFCGVECYYDGTEFLVYGLDKQWFLDHPEIQEMKQSQKLACFAEAGALIVQVHPFRERGYIDHIRLYPRHVHAIEVCNASESKKNNELAEICARHYGLIAFAGSDNHRGGTVRDGATVKRLAGMHSDTPIEDVQDFIAQVKSGAMTPFSIELAAENGVALLD